MPGFTPPPVSAEKIWQYTARVLTSLATPDDIIKFVGKGTGTEVPANKSLYDFISIMEHEIEFPTAEALDDISETGEQTTTERTVAVSLPSGATIRRVLLISLITVLNNTATAQKIDVTVQGRKGSGSWNDYFSEDDVIGFGAVDGATTSLVAVSDISALVDGDATYGFCLSVNQSAAQSVRYTVQHIVVVTYRMA